MALSLKEKWVKGPWPAYVAVVIVIIWGFVRAHKGGDFDVFLQAADKMSKGENPYLPPFIRDLQYYYSPFFAWALIPFSKMPWWIPEFTWLLFSAWCFYRCWKLTEQYLTPLALSQKQYYLWASLGFAIVFRYLNDNFHMIQMTVFLLWVCLESVSLVWKGRHLPGGLLLGLGIAVKTIPLPFLPYLIYRNKLKASLFTVLSVLLFLWLPALFMGADTNNFLLREWWGVINPSNLEHSIETELGYHSLTAFIPVYLTETTGAVPIRRNFVQLEPAQAVWVMNIGRLCLVLLTLVFLRIKIFAEPQNKTFQLREISYIALCVPLLFPHQQKYEFLFILPAVLYLLYCFMAKPSAVPRFWKIWGILAAVILTLTVSGLLGRYGYDVAQHFRVMTVGALMLIPLLLYCKPQLR